MTLEIASGIVESSLQHYRNALLYILRYHADTIAQRHCSPPGGVAYRLLLAVPLLPAVAVAVLTVGAEAAVSQVVAV